mgnify:CR=1 FL=1
MFRESCYKCKYATENRTSDITMGDFLGVLKVQPESYNKDGISICLVNTNKGEELLKELEDKLSLSITSIDKAKKYNSNLSNPTKRPKERDYIYNNINNDIKFIEDLNKYIGKKQYIKALIPTRIKVTIKKSGGKNR